MHHDYLGQDDYGNVIHWSYIHQTQSSLGLTGWQDSMIEVACDNAYGV